MNEGGPKGEGRASAEHIPELDSALRGLFESPDMVFGHGTTPDIAEKIMRDGLEARTDRIDETVLPLFDRSRGYDGQAAAARNQVLNWEHHGARAVVIVVVPKMPEPASNIRRYVNSAFERIEESADGERPYRIPARYIRGYVDADKKVFIENPAFDPLPLAPPAPRTVPSMPDEDIREQPTPPPEGHDADIF